MHKYLYYGYFNFFNFGVTDACVALKGTTYCGLNYAYKSGWKGVDVAINGGIEQFSKGYIQKGQYTGYFQKFDVNKLENIASHQYMTNVSGAMSESSTAFSAYEKNNLLGLNLVFKIPVFNNMNATIINGGSGAIDNPEDGGSKPSTIPISTIVTSSGFRYTSKYISNIAVGTDVTEIKGALESVAGNATVNISDKDGNNVTNGIMKTGYKVSINNQSSTEVLEVIIKGDTSGDGEINALDLLQVVKNISGSYNLEGAFKEAADTSGDGEINALDVLQIVKNISGSYKIIQ